eukprot:CAMPEP_0115874932 /NCGR_PEP_ID=MMETSP0287-20121206/24815_1 /TAXON_ID=412157 /ORGANISM="Chrysochromulina rotalis, Strain UIO044" /LENGTH=402 /DNA_ID=CAMNT_0003330137 /DNA_START=158 /DNA_END=1366 /DNA_ORIENTATION=+
MTAHFILHGLDARKSVLDEAIAQRDILFLRGPAVMTCKAGPLHKLMLWLECATAAWPRAELIGKADDDVWAHLPGIALHVERSFAALAISSSLKMPAAPPGLVWGSMESYHWHEGFHRPVGFSGMRYAFRRLSAVDGPRSRLERCRRRLAPRMLPLPHRDVPKSWLSTEPSSTPHSTPPNGSHVGDEWITGPFFFPKGPFYLVSSSLVRQILREPWVVAEAHASIRSGHDQENVSELTWPWEDVFLGLALSRATRGSEGAADIAAVHVGASNRAGSVFVEEWGVKAARSTLVWHMRTKVPERQRLLEEYAATSRCDRSFERMEYCHEYTSCTGTIWRACEHALSRSARPSTPGLKYPKVSSRRGGAGAASAPGPVGTAASLALFNCSDRLENLLTKRKTTRG